MLDLLPFGQKTAPDFFWDARGGTLPPGATFTRGSSGWFFNSAGVLTQAGNNVARFDYDPATLQPFGYLAEVQSTNGFLQSGDLSNASWGRQSIGVGGTKIAAPDGTTSMVPLQAGAATSAHGVSQVVTLASGGIAGHSIFFKKGTNNYAYINVSGAAGNYITVVFDLLNGAVGETKTGGISGSISSTSIRHVGGGVYRCAVIGSIGATNPTVEFGLATAASGNTFTAIGEVTFSAVGTEAIYGWGGQSETAGVGITSYIPTGGTSVTRAADVLSLPLTAVSGWNASKGGVLMGTIRLHTLGPNATPTAVMIEDAGLNNLVGIEAAYGAGLQRGELWSGGVSQARPQGVAARAPFVRTKITFGWGMTRTQIANDGNLANTVIGAFLLPVGPTKISIGNSGGAAQLNGAVESIAYYTGARSDAFVQSVSQ